jgi:DNA-binding Lrp family transcriptional regulator
MHKKLDNVDVRILEGLGQHGPRNIKKLADALNMPRGTVLSRIKHMSSSFYLRLLTTVYHTNMGLKKAVVFARAPPGLESLLFDCMKVNDFYIYLARCFGKFEGCIGVYVIPVEHTAEFELFLKELTRLGVAQDVNMLWSTCFHTVNLTSQWFDVGSQEWIFPWNKWLDEIPLYDGKLPYTLIDPEIFPLKADETDLFITKELEKDATISLADLARKRGTTLQNIRYHYETHIVKNQLIETFQIALLPFASAASEMLFFTFRFSNEENMSKFAQSLLDKPFVNIMGKVLTENTLISQLYLPLLEFRKFIDALSKLARSGFLESYDYLFQDLRPGKWSRVTIPYEFFKNGSWEYRHEKHVKSLIELVTQGASVEHNDS